MRPAAAEGGGRWHAILLNGGGTRAQNFQSHLLHVRELFALLGRAGIPTARITVFGSDGTDPAPDLAVRAVQPEADFWLLERTRVGGVLRTPITYENSTVPGATLLPATTASLRAWFARARGAIAPGDTLLLYVTDHGTKGERPDENRITLWGEKEGITVAELRGLLGTLDRRVRVLALMSQCFSGGFAGLMTAHTEHGLPAGNVCGYFSSTPDRLAYGCYPENLGVENVGHSFLFLRALAPRGDFAAAHREVLVTDDTPDVPLTTGDAYVEERLRQAARAEGRSFAAFVDGLLREAWRDRAAWEPEIRLLDRIGHAYGLFSPRSLAEIEEQVARLRELGTQLRTHERAWENALGDATDAALERFLAARPAWRPRLEPAALQGLPHAEARALTASLLDELGRFGRATPAKRRRLELIERLAFPWSGHPTQSREKGCCQQPAGPHPAHHRGQGESEARRRSFPFA